MAEDTLVDAIAVGGLPTRACVTEQLPLHGHVARGGAGLPPESTRRAYGADLPAVEALAEEDPTLAEPLHPNLPYTGAQIVWGARREMARTLDDVLARRTRALILDARAASEIAPRAAELLARELGRDADWVEREVASFRALARGYLLDAD
jgi:glycerol-3-phosphate dehydrogenase